MRRATFAKIRNTLVFGFQSTLSMRRATEAIKQLIAGFGISIHALHEESDLSQLQVFRNPIHFNPRSP